MRPHALPWSPEYPVREIPAGLRPVETMSHDMRGAVKVYRWPVMAAEREGRRMTWRMWSCEAYAEVALGAGNIVHGGVYGPWNRLVDEREWKRMGLRGFWALDPDRSAAQFSADRSEIVDMLSAIACGKPTCDHGTCIRARDAALRVAGMLPLIPTETK